MFQLCNDCPFSHRVLPCHLVPQNISLLRLHFQDATLPHVHVGRFMWSSVSVFLGGKGGRGRSFFLSAVETQHEYVVTHSNRKPKQVPIFSYRIALLFFGCNMIQMVCFCLNLGTQPKNTHVGIVDKHRATARAQDEQMDSTILQKRWKMSTSRAETHQLELFVLCFFLYHVQGCLTNPVETSRACVSASGVGSRRHSSGEESQHGDAGTVLLLFS